MRLWFDTEFIEDGRVIDLLSIGVVREDGAEYYAEVAETDRSRANAFVHEHVIPHLTGPVKPRRVIAQEIRDFAGPSPEFWGDYAAYDWVALCQLYGSMASLPEGWPWYSRDLRQWVDDLGLSTADLPQTAAPEHHALADAREVRDRWHFLAPRHLATLASQRSDPDQQG
jgi:hypothetical protein